MCKNAVTSIFSDPKIEAPKPAPTPAAPAVNAAGVQERQRAAQAVNSSSARVVTDDRLDADAIQRPKLLGS